MRSAKLRRRLLNYPPISFSYSFPFDFEFIWSFFVISEQMGKKQTKFKDLPNFLAFSLIRSGYDGTNKKIFDRYEFEEELDMKPYVAQEMETQVGNIQGFLSSCFNA